MHQIKSEALASHRDYLDLGEKREAKPCHYKTKTKKNNCELARLS